MGCTLEIEGITEKEILLKIKKEIVKNYPSLFVNSDVIIYNNEKIISIYEIIEKNFNSPKYTVVFRKREKEENILNPIGLAVSQQYNKKLKNQRLSGVVHFA